MSFPILNAPTETYTDTRINKFNSTGDILHSACSVLLASEEENLDFI